MTFKSPGERIPFDVPFPVPEEMLLDEKGNEQASPLELVRLAFPRRVYTQSHFDYLIEVIKEVWKNKSRIPGYRITYQTRFLRHFTCHFKAL